MGHEPSKVLTFPVAITNVPAYLVDCNVTRAAARDILGIPHLIDSDGLGTCDFWAFEYACGMQVVYQFFHYEHGGCILADSPEVNHVLRHCPFDQDDCIPMAHEGLNHELERLVQAFPFRQTEIRMLNAFQVWRQDDNGNTFAVGSPTSERDARCWVNQLESLGHKQTYWYTHVEDHQHA